MHFTKTEALRDLQALRNALSDALDANKSWNMKRENELELALEDIVDVIFAMYKCDEVLTREERLMVHSIVQRAHDTLS